MTSLDTDARRAGGTGATDGAGPALGLAGDVVGFDAFEPTHRANPYPRYQAMRELAPFCPIRLGAARVTLATRYDECAAVLQGAQWGRAYDEGLNSFRPGVDLGEVPGGSFLTMDPPDHTRLRGLVSRAFTPRASLAETPFVERVVTDLVDAALAAGGLDVVADLARPMSLAVMGRLLGIATADASPLLDWIQGITRGTDPDSLLSPDEIAARTACARDLGRFLLDLIAERRERPREDLVSRLAAVQRDQGSLTVREVVELVALLLAAGLDTTANLVANGTLALLRHPDQLALLRARPDLLPAAIEEMLRYDPPSQFVTRVALTDTTVGEHRFRRGDGVVVLSASGHRDPAASPIPTRSPSPATRRPHPRAATSGSRSGCTSASALRSPGSRLRPRSAPWSAAAARCRSRPRTSPTDRTPPCAARSPCR
ncbi:Cytochrome P450 [Frankia canadensis]|uniref:Cytochrome P450 n=1 Tax=Frankia canadensis TaxID=1836972 RepID=A0A2I2L0P6_9ACTN|nr:Cytochrome P450 [Frankia canadensis]SOU58774.1 Cytochrome P450 [Frankia canadensis]